MKEYFMNRNRVLFIRRNCNFITRAVFWPYFMFVVAPRNVLSYIKNGEWKFIKMLLKAIGWNMTNGRNSKHLGYPVKQ